MANAELYQPMPLANVILRFAGWRNIEGYEMLELVSGKPKINRRALSADWHSTELADIGGCAFAGMSLLVQSVIEAVLVGEGGQVDRRPRLRCIFRPARFVPQRAGYEPIDLSDYLSGRPVVEWIAARPEE